MREQQRAQEQRISQLLAVKGWMRQLKRLPWQEEQQSVQWLEQRLIEAQGKAPGDPPAAPTPPASPLHYN